MPHGGKGAAVRAGMLAATATCRLHRRRHGDATRSAAAAGRPPWPITTSPSARGSSPTAPTCAPPSPAIVGCSARSSICLHRSGSSVRSRTPSAGSRDSRRAAARDLFARQQITSIVFDVELIYLARRRGYRIAIVPIRWYDKRGSRMRASAGLALRVAWDLFRIPLIHRARRRARRPADLMQPRLARAAVALALPVVASSARSSLALAVSSAVAGETLGYDFRAYDGAAAPDRCRRSRSTTRPSRRTRRAVRGSTSTRRRSPSRSSRSRSCRQTRPRGLDRPAGRRSWSACRALPVSWRARAGGSLLLAGLLVPVVFRPELGNVSSWSSLLFAVGWRWLDTPSAALGACARWDR